MSGPSLDSVSFDVEADVCVQNRDHNLLQFFAYAGEAGQKLRFAFWA
jgi:hypothetical protein